MNDTPPLQCPHCGSPRLVASPGSRHVFLDHKGDPVPLLTVNFCLDRPVMEKRTVLYSCGCSWSGTADETGMLQP